jgi:hypothetical protein
MARASRRWLVVAIPVLALCAFAVRAAAPAQPASVEGADRLFEQKNYAEAADAYKAAVDAQAEGWRRAAERLMTCKLRLSLYDDALKAAEDFVARTAGTPYEARAERLTGHLYMLLPHWGSRSGGQFYRGEHRQGIFLQSWRYDKKHAVAHMERARELYAKYDGDRQVLAVLPTQEAEGWHAERIECVFDLVNLLSRFSIYDDQPHYWYRWWGERDETLAETAGEKDFDEGYGDWEWQRKRPIGLRLDADGRPIFPATPPEYKPELPDDEKMLYLLAETRSLDKTAEHKYEALSYYRQAMLARKRFGMDRLSAYAGMYYDGTGQPLQEELKSFNPWDLKDAEALVLAGGRIMKVELPAQHDVFALLRTVVGDYRQSGIADQAHYAVGLYYQSRQQYRQAIAEYEALRTAFPQGQWAREGASQISRIRQPQVQISQSSLQLPGRAATLQLSYRNLEKVWFTARRVDLPALLKEVREATLKEKEDAWRYFNLLRAWQYCLTNRSGDNWANPLVAKHLGVEVARWAGPVPDDGTHRYAQATLQSALSEQGGYVVYAYTSEPPAADADKAGLDALELGSSRAVVVLTDLAFVQKKTDKGDLYYVADAESGAPVPRANVDVLEVWGEYDRAQRKQVWNARKVQLTSDADGMAMFASTPERGSNLHVLISTDGGRLAWSGMEHWYRYQPSQMRDGLFAYLITDRPVYRPEQTVRYKVWARRMSEGILANVPHQQFQVTVHDPRGNQVHTVSKMTDDFGGLDGEFKLAEEPSLGVYRVQVSGQQYAGGGNFRVEEYKKPEFEVTVEPDVKHAKLGQKLSAVIKAKYYFGAPVTEGTVKYRVFREEFTYSYYPFGPWDWLYGPGYGYAWYAYDWFPWWSEVRCCWCPPPWWWGYSPSGRVRELVQQGEEPMGADGTLKVEIDTAPALRDHPDRDHRYVVQAEVCDASRRVITGEGDVKVTRQAFYAFVRSDRGYYRPGEEMQITLRCLTPDGSPVKAQGVLTVSSVVYGGPGNAHIEEKELDRWTLAADERGEATLRLRHEKSDLLKFTFTAPDEWGGTVRGHGLVWVCGRDFDGRLYRFNDIELITDKRTYKPGETCHLMLNTRRPDSYVLFADQVDNGALLSYKLLHLQDGHAIVDVPIKEGDQPNFFVEATTLSDLRVHQQLARICVPPEDKVVSVAVQPDKAEYRPGQEATVKVTALTPEGKPADVQVTLSAFDKSVLYIQPEYTPPIAGFFHGRVRSHNLQMSTNVFEQFAAWGYVRRPFEDLSPLPPAWTGTWGVEVEGWAWVSDKEFVSLYGAPDGLALGGGGVRRMAMAEEANGAPMAAGGLMMDRAAEAKAPGPEAEAPAAFAEAEVRQQFADTALWVADAATGPDGTAVLTFRMPENLTTWKVNAWAMSKATRVGQASSEATTTKNLIVRLQAPRFFMEYDEVVLSANVHNYLASAKRARVSLDVPAENLALLSRDDMQGSPQTVDVEIPAGGEKRVDWRVKVLKEGTAAVTVKALTDEESDAMRMTFPVLVHGMTKQEGWCGSARPDERSATRTVEFTVPERRRPELTRLEVQFAPSLVGAMMDALPYCLDYPYGCTEQTVSRFLPAVLTLKTLQNMGVTLEQVRDIRGRLAEVRRVEKGEHRRVYADNPIFDSEELQRIIDKGLKRIAEMQHGDGGWAWWKYGDSSGYLTAYILQALVSAQECDVAVDERMIQRGMEFLRSWELGEMRQKYWAPHESHAFAAYVLSLKGLKAADKEAGDCIERLYEGRDKLGLYGKALLSLALANLKDTDRAGIVLRNIMQFCQENPETGIAWFRTPQAGWWYWYNNDIETNAWCLRALVRLEPKSDVAPRLVKWLLENRRNGYYWRSTRDTTLCVAAMSEFVRASGEGRPDYTLTVSLDGGAIVKQVRISSDNFFTYDNSFVVEGVALGSGKHTLTLTKDGPGALYYAAYLRYFTKEERITAAGLQLKLDRAYYLLRQIPFAVEVEGARGQKLTEQRLRYERVPLKDGDPVQSGDLIQVELRVTSDNDYTYLIFEDPKPAGCEPTEVRSGGQGQEGFYSYMELRDEKVAFFADAIARGEHLLRYRLRAEIPGLFHALPAVAQGMYVPELRGNSDEALIRVEDR